MLRIGGKFAAFAFGKMIDMVLGLYFCHPLCLHRVYLYFFSLHLQSSLSTFKIKQRCMYKAYVRIRTAECWLIFRWANTIDETLTFLFIEAPTTTNEQRMKNLYWCCCCFSSCSTLNELRLSLFPQKKGRELDGLNLPSILSDFYQWWMTLK